jgi:PAS domain S-box-containing protein
VLVENGSQMHEYLESMGLGAEVVPAASEPAALRQLAAGAQDAAVVPLLLGAMEMRDRDIHNVRRVGDAVYSRDLCFAVAKGSSALLQRLDTGLAVLNQTGEYARLYQKWFGGLERPEETPLEFARRAAWILVPLLALSMAALGWSWVLRRQVQERTREYAQANRSLQEKERFLKAVVENLPVAVYGKDPRRGFAYALWNAKCTEVFGLLPEEALGRTDADLEPPEAAALFRRTDEAALQGRCRLDLPDDFSLSAGRGPVLLHTVKVPIFDELGEPWMLLAISEDVTERRRIEQDLVRSRAGLAEAQQIARLGSWEWDLPEGGTRWSEELHRILEFDPGTQPPSLRRAFRRVDQDSRRTLAHLLRTALRNGEEGSLDCRAHFPEGREKYLHVTVKARRDGTGSVVRLLGTVQDLTERRSAEEALRQAQKLEGLGVLAGGIAHDFNNLLTALMANLNLAQMTVPEEARTARHLQNLEATLLRAANLTRQMLAYSGRGTFVIQALDLNQVAREITQLLQASIPKKAGIRFELQPGLPCIDADIAQVQQVLMNLVTNAAEAIGEQEGTITLATRLRQMEGPVLAREFPGQELRPGPFVMLEVTDTGCGMTAEVRERLFEPFFTTKFSGRGLGLAALKGILKGHHAGIRIESAPGRGSLFQIAFPAGKGSGPVPPDAAPAGMPLRVDAGAVLLVDDEPAVRSSTADMLRAMGLQVIEAGDGEEALAAYRREPDAIAVVLLDLTMPRMDGHETLRELRKLKPGVKVILCSGYHEQDAMKHAQSGEPVGFLQKPFRLRDLRNALARML